MPERFRTLRPLAAALALLAFTLAPQSASAAEPIRTVLDGRELTFDAPPMIENDRTLIPMRGILEPLGAKIEWNQESRMVTAGLNGHEIKVVIGSSQAQVDGKTVTMDLAAKIQSDRTYIPLRFFAENLGLQVGWDGETRTITLESRSSTVANRDSATTSRAGTRLVEIARQYVGIAYGWGGTTPETGFDCSGLVWRVAKTYGIELPRTSQEQAGAGIPVSLDALQPGDLVFFTTYAAGPSHVGIAVGDGTFIHAQGEQQGVTVTSLSKDWWRARFLFARRIVR